MAINIFVSFISVRSVFDAHWGGNALLVYSTTFLFKYSFPLSVRDGSIKNKTKQESPGVFSYYYGGRRYCNIDNHDYIIMLCESVYFLLR